MPSPACGLVRARRALVLAEVGGVALGVVWMVRCSGYLAYPPPFQPLNPNYAARR